MAEILIIDDDHGVTDAIATIAGRLGHKVASASTFTDGLGLVESRPFDLVLLDVRLPDGNGLELLPTIRNSIAEPEVIILTGYGDPDGAELAIRSGAWDYIEKPSSAKQIRLAIGRALQYQVEKTARQDQIPIKRHGIVGSSGALERAIDQMAKAAATDADVLLAGETGTGKELFASALHENSKRSSGDFVVVDCTALPKELVESTLFGHERGAFTGADRAKDGLIHQADGGTLFLDEVGELPVDLQKKFLRVLQERRYRPVGSQKEYTSNFRLVAATNRDLEAMVAQNEFREDLLYRLRALAITLPPLKERKDDVEELALYQIERLCKKYDIQPKGFSSDFFETLRSYDWPGNVRELYQALEKALASAGPSPVLFPKDLPTHIRIALAKGSLSKAAVAEDGGAPHSLISELLSADPLPALQVVRDTAMDQVESAYLQRLLSQTNGDIKRACDVAGLSRSRLYHLMKKYGMTRRT